MSLPLYVIPDEGWAAWLQNIHAPGELKEQHASALMHRMGLRLALAGRLEDDGRLSSLLPANLDMRKHSKDIDELRLLYTELQGANADAFNESVSKEFDFEHYFDNGKAEPTYNQWAQKLVQQPHIGYYALQIQSASVLALTLLEIAARITRLTLEQGQPVTVDGSADVLQAPPATLTRTDAGFVFEQGHKHRKLRVSNAVEALDKAWEITSQMHRTQRRFLSSIGLSNFNSL